MQDIKLVGAYKYADPDKEFVICDVNEGRTFLDPLILFSHEAHDPFKMNTEGLYAVGGEITPDTLFASYKWGIFPWFPYKEEDEVRWYCPEERYVIYPDKIHVSHSMRSLLNKERYRITVNQAFSDVIHNCRCVKGRDENPSAWLSDSIEDSFNELNRLGYAKSVEVWEGEELVGGFYGFFYKGVFEGDSMFSFRPSASKIGLILLCRNPFIEEQRIKLIDTQFETPNFRQLGGEYISYQKYRETMEA